MKAGGRRATAGRPYFFFAFFTVNSPMRESQEGGFQTRPDKSDYRF
jgi:hypothetical protein